MLKTYRIIPVVFILCLFGFTLITVSLVSADERDAFVQCQQMPTQPNNYKSLKRQKNCFRDVAKRLGAKKREGAFGACQRIKPNRVSTQKMQQKIDCFMDVASSLMPNTAPPAGATGMPPTMAAPPAAPPAQAVVPVESSGGEVAELNARIEESQSQVATLSGQHVELQSQMATLTTTNAQLQEQLRAASAAAEPLNAKMTELETQLSVANAAQEPLNAKVAELETQLSVANAAQEPLNAKMAELNAENARLLAMQTAPADPSGDEVAQLRSALDAERQSAKIASKWMSKCTNSTRSMLPSANAWRDNVLKFCG
jgi:myosin heavy subunit